jgi:hypothetical protein
MRPDNLQTAVYFGRRLLSNTRSSHRAGAVRQDSGAWMETVELVGSDSWEEVDNIVWDTEVWGDLAAPQGMGHLQEGPHVPGFDSKRAEGEGGARVFPEVVGLGPAGSPKGAGPADRQLQPSRSESARRLLGLQAQTEEVGPPGSIAAVGFSRQLKQEEPNAMRRVPPPPGRLCDYGDPFRMPGQGGCCQACKMAAAKYTDFKDSDLSPGTPCSGVMLHCDATPS